MLVVVLKTLLNLYSAATRKLRLTHKTHTSNHQKFIFVYYSLPKVIHSQGTWKLAKCSVRVRNGYDGDSETVSELARHMR